MGLAVIQWTLHCLNTLRFTPVISEKFIYVKYHYIIIMSLYKAHIYIYMYRCVPHIRPHSHKSPPTIFSRSSCTGIYLTHRPPQPNMASNMILNQNSWTSRFLWWGSNARTKPAYTEQLRNSPSIASVFASGVSATAHWKDTPVECLEHTAVHAVANLCQSIFTTRYSNFWRMREAKVDRCWTNFYQSVIY